jgi:hypothetical protein
MQMQDGGWMLWIGPIPKHGIRSDGAVGGARGEFQDFVTLLSRLTTVRAGGVDDWNVTGDDLRLRGQCISPTELCRARSLVVNAVGLNERGRAKATALEQFITYRYPQVAVINPMQAEPVFRSKIAFYEMASANPKLRDTVVAHQVIRSGQDVDAAIERFSFPIVVKPDDLAGGHGMRLVHDRKEFVAHVRTIRLHPLRYRVERLLQPFRETGRRWLGRKRSREHHYLNNGRIVANPFVETFKPDVGGRIQVSLSYLGPQLVMIRGLVFEDGWNLRTAGERYHSLRQMGHERFERFANAALDAVERSREELMEVRRAIRAWPVRLDTMLDTTGRLVVSEPEPKWGWGNKTTTLIDGMSELGYDPAVIAARTGLNVRIDVGALARAGSHMG